MYMYVQKYNGQGDLSWWRNRTVWDPGQSSTGDPLAPYLFVIVLDYAFGMAIDGKEEELGFQLTTCRRQSRRIGPETVTDFDFADDIALLSEGLHQAQQLLQRVETSVAKVGLKMNVGKTKFRPYVI